MLDIIIIGLIIGGASVVASVIINLILSCCQCFRYMCRPIRQVEG